MSSGTVIEVRALAPLRLSPSGVKVATVLLIVALCGAYFYRLNPAQPPVVSVPVDTISEQLGEWKGGTAATLESASRDILQLDRYVRRMYRDPADTNVFLYIGYWKQQNGDSQAAKHTPSLCLPSNGWHIERLGKRTLSLPFADGQLRPLEVNRIVGEIDRSRHLIYYYFTNGTEYYPEEWQSLARISWNAFLRRRTDGGIVEVSTELKPGPEGMAEAERALLRLLTEVQPKLDHLIASAKETR